MADTLLGRDHTVYAISETRRASMCDLLAAFERHGNSRMTDPHPKAGLPPVYRVDGELKITHGRSLHEPVAVAMVNLNHTRAGGNLIRQLKPEQIATLIQTQTRDVPEQRMGTLERSPATLVRQGRISRDDALKASNHRQLPIDELSRDEGEAS